MQRHVPFHIVSGFLGSGKTTLVNRILHDSHGKRFAVIVNEFGKVGLDDKLLDVASGDFVKMDNGCLCCALNEDLVLTLKKLAARDDYDAVILETTGVADPLPITWAFYREAYLGAFRFGGIVTVVDALHLDTMLANAEETQVQVERGDFIYLAKTDLCSDDQLDHVTKKIRTINSFAKTVDARESGWMDLIFDFEPDQARRDFVSSVSGVGHHHDHGANFDSVSLPIPQGKKNVDELESVFEDLPPEVFRAKTVFWDEIQKKVFAMHAVCGRVEFYELAEKKQQDAPDVVVLIGKGLDESKMKIILGGTG